MARLLLAQADVARRLGLWLLAAGGLALASLAAVGAGSTFPGPRPGPPEEAWARLVATGDALAAGAAPSLAAGAPPSARTAYLLAFHAAQDTGDLYRMLAAAERLHRVGEEALALHVRRAARHVAREAGRPRADALPADRPR